MVILKMQLYDFVHTYTMYTYTYILYIGKYTYSSNNIKFIPPLSAASTKSIFIYPQKPKSDYIEVKLNKFGEKEKIIRATFFFPHVMFVFYRLPQYHQHKKKYNRL